MNATEIAAMAATARHADETQEGEDAFNQLMELAEQKHDAQLEDSDNRNWEDYFEAKVLGMTVSEMVDFATEILND